jgi:hypothetical protein
MACSPAKKNAIPVVSHLLNEKAVLLPVAKIFGVSCTHPEKYLVIPHLR